MKSLPPRILLVEPEGGGHHFVPHGALLLRALRSVGVDAALMTTRTARAHPALTELESMVGAPCELWDMPEIPGFGGGSVFHLAWAQFRYWRAVRAGFRRQRRSRAPDLCILLGLDSVDRAIAALGNPFGRTPFVGLTIQTKHHWPEFGIGPGGRNASLNRATFDRVLARRDCLGIATIDQTLVEYQLRHGRAAHKLRHVPDPGEVVRKIPRDQARADMVMPVDAPVILVYGGLDDRKNVGPLLRAAAAAASAPTVVLAGVVDDEVYALAYSPEWQALEAAGRLRIENGFVTLEREARLFAAADVAWVGYRADFNGHSAVIPQAASVGVPVLGRRGGLIGTTIEAHGLGLTLDPLDSARVSAAIDELAMARRDGRYAQALARFAASRSHLAYGAAWLAALADWHEPIRAQIANSPTRT